MSARDSVSPLCLRWNACSRSRCLLTTLCTSAMALVKDTQRRLPAHAEAQRTHRHREPERAFRRITHDVLGEASSLPRKRQFRFDDPPAAPVQIKRINCASLTPSIMSESVSAR
jgi:hypothetical protein